MTQFVAACKESELPAGKLKTVSIQGINIAVLNAAGTFLAIGNTCPHRGGPLGEGAASGTVVTCPWHGFQFDCATGESAEGKPLRVPNYKTRINNGMVEIEL